MESNAFRLPELKVGAIINTSSGGRDLESEEKILNILKSTGIVEPKTWCGGADQMERSFAEATGRSWRCLSCLGATAPSGQLIPATLDGESVSLGTMAEIDFVSRALTVLVPAK
jgi:diacylglycerol kinase family enzyme